MILIDVSIKLTTYLIHFILHYLLYFYYILGYYWPGNDSMYIWQAGTYSSTPGAASCTSCADGSIQK